MSHRTPENSQSHLSSRVAAAALVLAVTGGIALAAPTTQPGDEVTDVAAQPVDPNDPNAGSPRSSGSFWRSEDPNKLLGSGPSTAGLLWQMLASVLVVAALGVAVWIVSKRVLPKLRVHAGRRISVLETTYLAPRKAVHLLEAGGRRFLVASTRDRISLLAEVSASASDGDEPAGGKDEDVSFQAVLGARQDRDSTPSFAHEDLR